MPGFADKLGDAMIGNMLGASSTDRVGGQVMWSYGIGGALSKLQGSSSDADVKFGELVKAYAAIGLDKNDKIFIDAVENHKRSKGLLDDFAKRIVGLEAPTMGGMFG